MEFAAPILANTIRKDSYHSSDIAPHMYGVATFVPRSPERFNLTVTLKGKHVSAKLLKPIVVGYLLKAVDDWISTHGMPRLWHFRIE